MSFQVVLRPVTESDLPTLFAHQDDPWCAPWSDSIIEPERNFSKNGKKSSQIPSSRSSQF